LKRQKVKGRNWLEKSQVGIDADATETMAKGTMTGMEGGRRGKTVIVKGLEG